MKNKIIEIQVTGCNNCPACDAELPKKCPLRKADVILKLKIDVMGAV